jgi:hypothetical protein
MAASISPSEWLAVAGSNIRAVASLAAGSSRRATIRASARSRRRCGAQRGSTASSAMRRAVPSAASTCLDQVLAALLIFRVIYFLVPLVTACALFGGLEAAQARRRITRVSQDLAGWLSPAAPTVLAGCSFLGGTVLLFSNAMPESGMRLQLASALLRLPIIEASHFLGSVVGVFLLLLSSQVQRRSHAAWLIALLLLLVGSMAQLLNGLEWGEAVLLLLFFFVLLTSRDESLSAARARVFRPATPDWVAAPARLRYASGRQSNHSDRDGGSQKTRGVGVQRKMPPQLLGVERMSLATRYPTTQTAPHAPNRKPPGSARDVTGHAYFTKLKAHDILKFGIGRSRRA